MNRYILAKAGIDMNEGLRRFNNNREFYEKALLSITDYGYYAKMKESIMEGDAKQAFQAAHALKGLCGTLSCIQLHADLIPLVEELRSGSMEHVPELFSVVEESYEKVIRALSEA